MVFTLVLCLCADDTMRGVLFTEGEVWRDQRRFALHVLRDFGMGKNIMQEKVSASCASSLSTIPSCRFSTK